MEHNILYEQIAYYRARAEEYDESIYQVGRYASPGESNEDLGELEVALKIHFAHLDQDGHFC